MFSEEMLNNNVQDEKFHVSSKQLNWNFTMTSNWEFFIYFEWLYTEEKYAFLDLLIREAENGADLSDDDIRGEVDTFMFAVNISYFWYTLSKYEVNIFGCCQGHDTVSLAMSWFLHCIAKHPEKQVIF